MVLPPNFTQSHLETQSGLTSLLVAIMSKRLKPPSLPDTERLERQFQVIETWWVDELDTLKLQIVKRCDFCRFLKAKGVISDDKELARVLGTTYTNIVSDHIRKSEYLRLMSRAIMRNVLASLCTYFERQRRTSLDRGAITVSQRVLQLQRAVLIDGIEGQTKKR